MAIYQPQNVAKHRTSLVTALKGVWGASLMPRFSLEMPGVSYTGEPPPLTPAQAVLARELEAIVRELAGPMAGRNVFHLDRLRRCEEFLESHLRAAGLSPTREAYSCNATTVHNIHAMIPGTTNPDEIVVLGAHYDAVELRHGLCPAANDNGSGVATCLTLAQRLATKPCARSVRISLWVNEEPPFFWTDLMGSLVDARASRARGDKIVAMLTPETLGCYLHAEGSQRYPLHPILSRGRPTRGDFVAFLGMHEDAWLVRACVGAFRAHASVPSLGAALPAIVPHVGASDHWSFWNCGYPALMITDTAPYRYRYYHTHEDLPEHMQFEPFARVVDGLEQVVRVIADPARTTPPEGERVNS